MISPIIKMCLGNLNFLIVRMAIVFISSDYQGTTVLTNQTTIVVRGSAIFEMVTFD